MGFIKDLFKSDQEKADEMSDKLVAKLQGLDQPDYDKLSKDLETPSPEEQEASRIKTEKAEAKRKKEMTKTIKKLLKDKAVKMPASDIDAHLKHQNVDEIKELCEEMYHNGEINRTGNYRYFILSEEKKESKKASVPKSEEVDVKAELKKYKEMLDEGLITQEAYDAKMNQLLGL